MNHKNIKYLFVMEDDVYFDTDHSWVDDLLLYLDQLSHHVHWACNLGYLTGYPSWTCKNNMVTMFHCYCTHAYIIPIQTVKKLSQLKWYGQPFDVAWHDCIDVFYAPSPMIALQLDHDSDISVNCFWKRMLNKIGFKNLTQICSLWSQNCLVVYTLLIFFIVIVITYMLIINNIVITI
jgi:hypothetical protein